MPLFVDLIKRLNPHSSFILSQIEAIPSFCSQENFRKKIENERARADRTGHCFSVVSFKLDIAEKNNLLNNNLLEILKKRLRSTDGIGFIDENHIGILLNNTPANAVNNFTKCIQDKIGPEFPKLQYEVYTYPFDQSNLSNNSYKIKEYKFCNTLNTNVDTNDQRKADIANSAASGSKKISSHSTQDSIRNDVKYIKDINSLLCQGIPAWKRCIDLTGAAFGIVFLSPLFLLIAILIKLTSPGPIFFKQERIGCNGRPFIFWKFRTMAHNLDTTKHQKYLAQLINESGDKPMLKIDREMQLIPFGAFLRKSCLDELPQLYNVLRGEMSLVGPRPPIPYEVNEYKSWHTRRLNTIPGMTGLWQISGKNRLSFSEMVRLDINYTRHINMLSELKILLMTPISIIFQSLIGR